jgi:Flagellar hook-length control protein FliK
MIPQLPQLVGISALSPTAPPQTADGEFTALMAADAMEDVDPTAIQTIVAMMPLMAAPPIATSADMDAAVLIETDDADQAAARSASLFEGLVWPAMQQIEPDSAAMVEQVAMAPGLPSPPANSAPADVNISEQIALSKSLLPASLPPAEPIPAELSPVGPPRTELARTDRLLTELGGALVMPELSQTAALLPAQAVPAQVDSGEVVAIAPGPNLYVEPLAGVPVQALAPKVPPEVIAVSPGPIDTLQPQKTLGEARFLARLEITPQPNGQPPAALVPVAVAEQLVQARTKATFATFAASPPDTARAETGTSAAVHLFEQVVALGAVSQDLAPGEGQLTVLPVTDRLIVTPAAVPVSASAVPLPPTVSSMLIAAAPEAAQGPVALVLNPEELGQLRFEIHQSGEQLRVVLAVERPETLDLLRRHADQLMQEFRAAGFAGASLSFGQWGAQGDRGAGHENGPMGHSEPLMADVPQAFTAPAGRNSGLAQGLNIRL